MCNVCQPPEIIIRDLPHLEPSLKQDRAQMIRYTDKRTPYMVGEALYVSAGQWAYTKGPEGRWTQSLGHISKIMPQVFEDGSESA